MKKILLSLFIIGLTFTITAQEDVVGRKAPNFQLENLDGDFVELNDFLGDGPVLIAFWATWCKPCLEELIQYKELKNKYEETGFKVLAISTDSEKSVAKVKPFVRSKDYPFTVLLDTNSEVARDYYVQAVPYSVLLNQNGEIVYSHMGYMKGDEIKVEEKIKELIN